MKLITAIVRTSALDIVVQSLEDAGIKGITISEVKGTGEQVRLYRPYTIHSKIEVFIPDEKEEIVTGIILKHTSTGIAGDGVLAVSPVDRIFKIRTKEKTE
jgi:nitrogen regulatory protein P-II 1